MKRLLITVGAVILIMFSGGNGIAAPSAHRGAHKAIRSASKRITKSPAIPGSTYTLGAGANLAYIALTEKIIPFFRCCRPRTRFMRN